MPLAGQWSLVLMGSEDAVPTVPVCVCVAPSQGKFFALL